MPSHFSGVQDCEKFLPAYVRKGPIEWVMVQDMETMWMI